MLTVVIPARNEEGPIYALCRSARQYVEEVIVVDDGNDDATVQAASETGAKIVSNRWRKGYIETMKAGFRQAYDGIIITIDADGEHNLEDIPRLGKPIYDDHADLILGIR